MFILMFQFKNNFRISRTTAYKIVDMFENSAFYCSDQSHGGIKPTSAEVHILSFLW